MDLADFRGQFPYSSLEDKAFAELDSNDSVENLGKTGGTPHPFRVYSRREKGQGKRRGIYEEWELADTDLGIEHTCP